LPDL
ncbi:hypothetical protein CP8484711_1600, partial [Chlamydia psittaci 84-8471/1]